MKKIDVKFDVLLPVFNGGKTIRKTLESIFNQSFLPTNLIIIINGCCDDSEAIVDEFALLGKINILKMVEVSNIGLVGALNLGLKLCCSSWVARVDADDYWLSNHLFALRDGILKGDSNLGLIGGSAAFIENDNFVSYSLELKDYEIRKYLSRNNPFVHSAIAFKRNVIEEIGTYDPNAIFEDYDFWIRIMSKYKAEIIPSKMCVHVRSQNSLSASYPTTEALKERLRLQLKARKEFKITSPLIFFSIMITACRFFLQSFFVIYIGNKK